MNIPNLELARSILLDETPLAHDCGSLCGAACCQGNDHTGMLLFPGEETLYEGCTFGRILIGKETIGQQKTRVFVCRGTCPREQRPLSCRLFPLFLRFRDGVPRVRLDPRAHMCPLRRYGIAGLKQSFVERAEEVYNLLLQDEDCADFLHGLDRAFSL
ncbi:MAG: hypothetical protein IJT77_06890 [Clostridia bacterium]|nr:hypothetical protein [Clostridia bacterium]